MILDDGNFRDNILGFINITRVALTSNGIQNVNGYGPEWMKASCHPKPVVHHDLSSVSCDQCLPAYIHHKMCLELSWDVSLAKLRTLVTCLSLDN